MCNFEQIKKTLSQKHDAVQISNYINYLKKLSSEKDIKTKELKNKWFIYKKDQELIDMYNKIAFQGLTIDGDLVTIQSIGISLSYNAYKNLVLIKYPETKLDVQLVRETDDFNFQKKDGAVFYSHRINDPFDEKKIIGAYCIIKNRLGEFIELISLAELEKIRKTAKTDYIWRVWTSEMYLKTVIKRACKRHFKDITYKIDNIDNENYNLDNPLDIEIKIKQEIEKISSIIELAEYYKNNKEKVEFKKSFDKLVCLRKKELIEEEELKHESA